MGWGILSYPPPPHLPSSSSSSSERNTSTDTPSGISISIDRKMILVASDWNHAHYVNYALRALMSSN